ncbi:MULTISPECIES: hypothetical protein [Microbacterium]|uniref:Uncharacterized protein n=1 Tax=Microbacterium imperiale TaxID=33884 RepID=A0A9W6M462_9MICO|nr:MULTISPECIES: hypothetical protein [Microbacterium]MBP2421543.1 hypothetical protein [Microbacterium imperiale]MDD7928811.1 hypothetical protein [Microbacterium thalli]MDS0199350.1 hypothetical protein [Microbacterium imperiale]BFE41883.1 hypothetical protein GCM10017544_28390 [Microbacterium imperiale]GLJ80835.1 hypothetical protein GCM10017586_25180 [Microbacterium imperiale]
MKLKKLNRSLAKALVRDESDYSIAKMVEPLISNKALLAFFVPVALITVLQILQPFLVDESAREIGFAIIGWAFALWYVLAFLVVTGLVARWFFLHRAAAKEIVVLAEVSRRLGSALVRSHRSDPSYFEIVSWDENIKVDKRGNAVIDRIVCVKAGARPVSILWSACISFGPQVLPEQVGIQAFRKTSRGESPLSFDPTWDDTGGKLRSDIHIYPTDDLQSGEELTIRLQWKWPLYASQTLAKGELEPFRYDFNRPCHAFRVRVAVPSARRLEAIFKEGGGQSVDVTYGKSTVEISVSGSGPIKSLSGHVAPVKK